MGSSVFFAGFSTLLSIMVLAPSKTYIFTVFFRLWFGTVLFGMANGMMLLPVILSFIGEAEAVVDHSFLDSDSDKEEKEENPDEDSKLNESE